MFSFLQEHCQPTYLIKKKKKKVDSNTQIHACVVGNNHEDMILVFYFTFLFQHGHNNSFILDKRPVGEKRKKMDKDI